jgi:phosphoglycolate/pyridoxal phosphate phosphatase family enzyme
MTSRTFFARYRAFLLDIDGVLVRGTTPIEGAAAALDRLRGHGRCLFLTNNSSRSRVGLADRLTSLGFTVDVDDVVPSSFIAARHLASIASEVTFWLVGERGLDEELRLAGHRPAARPEDAAWVVAGIDRDVTYETLARALRALRAGARLLATNIDPTFPSAGGPLPGAGAIVGALEGMGFPAEIVVGKPSPIAFRVALGRLAVDPASVLMIGDRLETDILGATDAGLGTALVLSGVADHPDPAASGIRPMWIAETLSDLAAGRVQPGDAGR